MKEILNFSEMDAITGINPIRIERSVVDGIGPTVINAIDVPVTRPSLPVTRGMRVPIINLPEYEYEYPILNIPPEPIVTSPSTPNLGGSSEGETSEEQVDPRQLPGQVPVTPTGPVVDIGGVEIPLPEVGVVATAGSIAVVTTAAGLGAGIVFQQAKNALTPIINEMVKKKFKVKIKKVKPVLHYVLSETGVINIFEYSAKGTKLLDTTENVEQYLRDQVDINSLYEYDNKVIIDDSIKEKFTKEGAKRFKNYFTPAKVLAKKLSAKFAF